MSRRIWNRDWKFILEKTVLRRHRPKPYEPKVREVLRNIKGRLFVDVGASDGAYSLLLRRNFVQVYSFEPNPETFEVLRWNIDKQKARNIKCYPIALADFTGETTLFLDQRVGISGLSDTILANFEYRPGRVDDAGEPHRYSGQKGVKVAVRKYDDVILSETADLVKVDVEGAEFSVLRGAGIALSENRIRSIMVELHNRDQTQELLKLLESYGFDTQLLDSHPRIFGKLRAAA